jgi:hypothetical protein
MKCCSHTYIETGWVGFYLNSPDDLEVCEYQRPRKSVEQYRGKRMEDKTIYECNECLLEDTEVPCRKVTSEKIDKKHCPFDEYLVANWKAILEANSQKGVRDGNSN